MSSHCPPARPRAPHPSPALLPNPLRYAGWDQIVNNSALGTVSFCQRNGTAPWSQAEAISACPQDVVFDVATFLTGLFLLFATGTYFGMTFTPPPAHDREAWEWSEPGEGIGVDSDSDAASDDDDVPLLRPGRNKAGDAGEEGIYDDSDRSAKAPAMPAGLGLDGSAAAHSSSNPKRQPAATGWRALQKSLGLQAAADPYQMTGREHMICTFRAVVSLAGQALMWSANQNMLDGTAPSPDVFWRPLFLTALGTVLMLGTDSYVANAFFYDEPPGAHDDEDDGNDEGGDEEVHPLFFWGGSFVSLCGQLIFNYGVWTLIDVFIAKTAPMSAQPGSWLTYVSTETNLALVLIGTALLIISNTLLSNAGVAFGMVGSNADMA